MKNILFTLCFLLVASFGFSQIKVVADGNVGIGEDTPAAKLEISTSGSPAVRLSKNGSATNYFEMEQTSNSVGTLRKVVASGNAVVDIVPVISDGTSNAAFRYFRTTNTTGSVDIAVHVGDGTNTDNARISGSSNTYFARNFGDVGIGTNSPTQKLSVNGTAGKPGGGTWATFSDKRLKKNIKSFNDGLDVLMDINPVSFQYNGKAGITDTDARYYGVIAQEIQKVAPYTVSETVYQEVTTAEDEITQIKGEEEKYLSYDGTALTYIAINAIQEQQEIIESLQEQIAELKNIIENQGEQSGNQSVILQGGGQSYLGQSFPNPTQGIATIKYELPENKSGSIQFFDISGKLLRSVDLDAQVGTLNINAEDIPSGTYNYSLVVDGEIKSTKRMVIAK